MSKIRRRSVFFSRNRRARDSSSPLQYSKTSRLLRPRKSLAAFRSITSAVCGTRRAQMSPVSPSWWSRHGPRIFPYGCSQYAFERFASRFESNGRLVGTVTGRPPRVALPGPQPRRFQYPSIYGLGEDTINSIVALDESRYGSHFRQDSTITARSFTRVHIDDSTRLRTLATKTTEPEHATPSNFARV